jgi:cytidine deaminase
MQQQKTINYLIHKNWRSLAIVPKAIEKKLEDLLESAYAPYSNYPVSSVVLMESGTLVVGTNQENAAFPDGLCGERVAVLAAKAAYPKESIRAIYIMTGEHEREPAAPCGSCRQVLHETELRQEQPFQLFLMNKTLDALEFNGVQDLLPFSFTLPNHL